MIAAIWACILCGQMRGWGSRPPERNYSPMLHCEHCKALTRHVFDRIGYARPAPARAAAVR